ncbi:MAG TPA: ABC transporter permease [Candidatus Gemmiger avistercoris]|uniref:ABC transporter permease n=1 Tax=Candidatus Gemmiger avistercoris TaxID=2838606 RepID=A0A9D2FHE4_9FIRM|nr:ABC transporter permease [uncultured Subdoligranulum sp.]HIZ61264.1 ABC transporter permease [Candidatus Gemmiger avistercoris]
MSGAQVSRLAQVQIYLGKHWRLFVNERGWKVLLFAAIISAIVLPVLGGNMFVYTAETFQGTFTLVSACIWIGIFNSIQSICKERAILKREHRAGLHMSSYIASHLIFQAGICLLQAGILLGISAAFLHYPAVTPLFGSTMLEFFITYFLVTYAADALGLAISAIVRTPTTAMTVMPFVLIVQLLFSGMLFTLQGPAALVGSLTISKWGMNAACVSADYNNLENTELVNTSVALQNIASREGYPLDGGQVDALLEEYYQVSVNEDYGHAAANLAVDWGVLALQAAVYGAAAVLALEFVDRDKR